ncbi:MAG: ParA family protein [Pseudomonadales bacterium]
MPIVSSFSLKGGVGKTTTAVNIAHIASSLGVRTLLWDLDPQGAASFFLKAKPDAHFDQSLARSMKRLSSYIVPTAYSDLDAIPTDFNNKRFEDLLSQGGGSSTRLQKILFPLLARYDLIVLDCPPGISQLAANALNASDMTLVPTIPTSLSVRTLGHLRKYAKEIECSSRMLGFFNLYDVRRSLHRATFDYYLAFHEEKMLKTAIPYSAIVERMGQQRRPLTDFAWSSRPSMAYRELYKEILSILEPAWCLKLPMAEGS